MLAQLGELFRQSARYARACPLLFLVPVCAEAVQHAVEAAGGMYGDLAHARAAEGSPVRLAFGVVKLVTLLLAAYWMPRWLEWRVAGRVGARDHEAERRFAPLLALGLAIQLASLWVIYGSDLRPSKAVALAAMLLPFLVGMLLADWQARAPIGVPGGPLTSARRILPILPWAFAFNLLASLPLMVAHYALGIGAIFIPGAAKWLLLALDTGMTGFLAAVLAGVPWYVSRHARQRASLGRSA